MKLVFILILSILYITIGIALKELNPE